MQPVKEKVLTKDEYMLYIHTPFCATCHIARAILTQIETALDQQLFYEMNASFFPSYMQEEKIKSVPCLYIKVAGEVKEKIYTFHSTANIVHFLLRHKPELFQHNKTLLS